MASVTALYTPEVLALATGLSRFPLTDSLPLHGEARSQSCGSSLELRLALSGEGAIDQLGLRSHACAIGQAAATIFAEAAVGRDHAAIGAAERDIEEWLRGGPLPVWPGIGIIAAAAAYPGRHGAIMLPWKAALAALSSANERR